MERKALIVTGAAGSDALVAETLNRFGFSLIEHAADVGEAIDRLRHDHLDLVILPLQNMEPLQLAALEREIRRERFTFVIGTAPRADAELMLRAMRAGIHEFLVSPPDAQDLAGAVDRLMRRAPSEIKQGQIFAVYSTKGGMGTSTVSVNLAYALARHHKGERLAIADLVVSGGDVRVQLNLTPSYDLGDLAQKLDRIDGDLLSSLLTPCSGGVWVLPAPDSPEADEQVDSGTITTIIQHLKSHYAFTVLDCEHHMSERTLAALDAADRILLITQLSVSALRSTQRSLALFRRLGYPSDKLCVVVNRYDSGDVLSISDATDVLKCEIFFKIPNDYRVASGALTKGLPIAEFDGESKLSWSYTQLAAKLGGTAASRNGASHHRDNGSGSRLRNLFARKRS